jgi:hypothetical protein
MTSRPSPLAITMACLPGYTLAHQGPWFGASDLAGELQKLGFSPEDASVQYVAAKLAWMAAEDAPWVERRRAPWGGWEYRVLHFGETDIQNRFGQVVSTRRSYEQRERAAAVAASRARDGSDA